MKKYFCHPEDLIGWGNITQCRCSNERQEKFPRPFRSLCRDSAQRLLVKKSRRLFPYFPSSLTFLHRFINQTMTRCIDLQVALPPAASGVEEEEEEVEDLLC